MSFVIPAWLKLVYLTCSISTYWAVLAAEINVPPSLFDVLALTAII